MVRSHPLFSGRCLCQFCLMFLVMRGRAPFLCRGTMIEGALVAPSGSFRTPMLARLQGACDHGPTHGLSCWNSMRVHVHNCCTPKSSRPARVQSMTIKSNNNNNNPPPHFVFKPRRARRWGTPVIQSNLAILSQSLMTQSLMIQSLMMQIQSLMLQSKYYHRPNYSYSYPLGPGQNHQNFISCIGLLTSPSPILRVCINDFQS